MDLGKIVKTIVVVTIFGAGGLLVKDKIPTVEERILSDRTEQAQEETVRLAVVPVGVYEWAWSIDSVLVIRYPNYLDKDSTLVEFDMNGNVPFPDWLVDTVKFYNWMTKRDFESASRPLKAYREGLDGSKIVRIERLKVENEN